MSLVGLSPPAARAPERGAALTLDRVRKRYGDRVILDDLTLRVPAGQFLAIVGRSGSGKSSLLRMICGLDRPTSGRVSLDGGAEAGVARIMFQEPRLLPWARVLDNVVVGLPREPGKADGRSRSLRALRDVGLETRARDWPAVLSGGQKQRVALARALVSRPRLLLLDEPLGALDALTRLEMQALVGSQWREQGFTAILVTHDVPEAVRLADRIVVLEQGAVTLDLPNPAPHPRRTTSAGSVELEDAVLTRLMHPS